MNKLAIVSFSAVGATALFAVSFLGFAKLNGVPLNSLPAIGGMFPAQAKVSAPTVTAGVAPAPVALDQVPAEAGASTTKVERGAVPAGPDVSSHDTTTKASPSATTARPREARAGVFDLLDTDGLYTQDELRALADSLRAKNREVDQRAAELDRREDLLTDRLTALDERRRTIDEFAKQLDTRERELKAREAEVSRDAKPSGLPDGKKLPAGDLSEFFSDGDTEILVQRLTGFTAEDIAQILIKLPPTRAKELLDALPAARWRECAEAYARAAQTPP